MNRFRQARDRGGRYLLDQVGEDGGFGDPELGVTEYYKVPAALLVCGFSSAANSLLRWIRRHGFLPNGDFGPRPASALNSYYYTYHNAWVIKAAHRLGAFDLAQRGMDFLLGFHDPAGGGFYSHPTERNPATEQDLWVVSGCGWCAIYTGRLDVARGVGGWMRRMMDDQPNYPEELWTVYSRSRGLITDVIDDDFRYVLTGDESRDQSFYHPGIAAGFLCRLYKATGEAEWLELAREYMRFCDYVGDYHFQTVTRRKGRLGRRRCSIRSRGEDKYRDMAVSGLGDNLVDDSDRKWRVGMAGDGLWSGSFLTTTSLQKWSSGWMRSTRRWVRTSPRFTDFPVRPLPWYHGPPLKPVG